MNEHLTKIELLSDQHVGCRLRKVGEVVECRNKRAKQLIESGDAVLFVEKKPKPKKEKNGQEKNQTVED